MHQIRFRTGLHPRSCWESLLHSPRLLAGFKGPTSKRKEERGRTPLKQGRRLPKADPVTLNREAVHFTVSLFEQPPVSARVVLTKNDQLRHSERLTITHTHNCLTAFCPGLPG